MLVSALHIVADGRRARRTAAELQAEAEKLEAMVSGVQRQLQLSGLCEYVDVRARDHVNMKYAGRLSRQRTELLQPIVVADAVILHRCILVHVRRYYLPRFPGLVHFIFVDVDSVSTQTKSIMLAKCLCTEE